MRKIIIKMYKMNNKFFVFQKKSVVEVCIFCIYEKSKRKKRENEEINGIVREKKF